MSKERIAIYPFSRECNVFSDYYDMISENYCIVEAASPLVWRITGKVLKTSEGEITIKKSPSEFEKEADTLLIPDFAIGKTAESGLINEIFKYMPKVKKIMYYGSLSYEGKQKLIDKAEELKIEFADFRDYSHEHNVDFDVMIEYCDVPVVAIAGVWENTNKFQAALAVNQALTKKGYNVLQIGSRGYAELFGAVPFPAFMLDPCVSEFNKPLMFSSYIKALAEKNKPDIIIVCIPGSMQMMNESFPNGSGVLQYTVFQALKPDYVLICSMYEPNPDIYNGLMKNLCMYRYGVELDAINMSRLCFDANTSTELLELYTISADDDMMKEALAKADKCEALLTDVTVEGQGEVIVESIIRKLSEESAI